MLISTVTCWRCEHLAGVQLAAATGPAAGTSSTNLAPNTVDDAMSTRDVGRDEVQLRRDPSPGGGRPARRAAISIDVDLADLNAVHLDLGVGVHHQAGAVRDHRHRNGVGEAAAEQGDGERDDRRDHHDGAPGPPAGVRVTTPSIAAPLSRQVEVAVGSRKRPARPAGSPTRRRSARCAPRCRPPRRHPRARRWRSSRSRCGSTGSSIAISTACRNDHSRSIGLRNVLK